MSKNRKIILIVVIAIIVLAIIAGFIYLVGFQSGVKDKILDGSTSKVNKLYSELKEKQNYSFIMTLDEKNKIYYAKKDSMAYIETTYQDEISKFIVKNGNSYLLMDDQKIYYKYENNETDLEKIIYQLEKMKDKDYVVGKEKIENATYKYEEYEKVTEFLIKDISMEEEQTAKTRLYFDGNKLVYIKTIVGDYEEILKIDISYQIDDNLFEIPSEYKEI